MGLLIEPPSEDLLWFVRRGLLSFTPAEFNVMRLVLAGLSSKEIGRELGISFRTAETHARSALLRCGSCSRADFLRAALALADDKEIEGHLKSLV